MYSQCCFTEIVDKSYFILNQRTCKTFCLKPRSHEIDLFLESCSLFSSYQPFFSSSIELLRASDVPLCD